MKTHKIMRHGATGTAVAAALALALAAAPATPAAAEGTVSTAAGRVMTLSKGRGQLITLNRPMSDLFVADPTIADVQVRSPTKLYIFGKGPGETTVSATAKNGAVVFAATIRVGNNISDVSQMLRVTMPDAHITATPMNGLMLLTGTVASPDDIEEASRLVSAFVGKDVQVISRLKAATPLQVMLRVRFAEVNRDLSKTIGFNILTQDSTGGFKFGIAQGGGDSLSFTAPNFTHTGPGSTLGFAGHMLGLDIISALDLAETNGYATTLAQPTLVALSGETASFLAGGEIPIPVPQYQGVTTIEYKQYGVSLAFTPTVLGDGRISLRVRPEVSQLTSSTVSINGYSIPGLTTRRAETTVELGSGQSFVIGGLLSNNTNNTIDKTPVLGDLPIIGQLFRSNNWKRSESELVIVVTPYLVKPVSDRQIALPTDGYRAPTDAQRFALDMAMDSRSGATRAKPQAAPPVTRGAPTAALPADTRRRDETPAAPGISYK